MTQGFLGVILLFFLFLMLACFMNTGSPGAALNFPLVLTVFGSGWSAGFLKELFFPLKNSEGK
jgi:hypothetical protein